jgi:hypothetical protein
MIASARVKGEWWPTVSENVRGRLHIARGEREGGRLVCAAAAPSEFAQPQEIKVTAASDKNNATLPWHGVDMIKRFKIVLDGDGGRAFVSPDVSFTNHFAADRAVNITPIRNRDVPTIRSSLL